MSHKLVQDKQGDYYLLDENGSLLIDFDGEVSGIPGISEHEALSPYTSDITHLEISETDANALVMKLLAITGGKILLCTVNGDYDPWTRWAREVRERTEGTIKP